MTTTKPVATKTTRTFRMNCAIECTIRADVGRVWALLTDAAGFPRWNSTVKSVEGPIVLGQTLKLEVPSAPGRVFKPKVTTFEPGKARVWSDGMAPMFKGVRPYSLTAGQDGSTVFSMHEE